MATDLPPLYRHQTITVDHLLANDRSLDTSDPGTANEGDMPIATRCIMGA